MKTTHRRHRVASRRTNGTNDNIPDTIPESIPYIIQNLKAVYGVPKPERGLDPLDVLIETILSQSTTNANSRRAFQNLKRRFPDWESARRARASSIEKAIKSGGLARQKAGRIRELLDVIHKRRGSLDLSFLKKAPLEGAKQFLSSLKGVGPKTVACTLLFACSRPVFPIDTHIFRIARRLGLIPDRCSDQEAHDLMGRMIPRNRYYEVHINLIRHGRKICRPRDPLCEECCLVDYCEFYAGRGYASRKDAKTREDAEINHASGGSLSLAPVLRGSVGPIR